MEGKKQYEQKRLENINELIGQNQNFDFLKGFLNYLSSERMSVNTKYRYLLYTINFLKYIDKPIEKIDFDDYTLYLTLYEKNCSSYQIAIYSALKMFSGYLFASKKTQEDPMLCIKRPKFIEQEKTVQKRNKGYLTEKEFKKYLNTVSSGVGSQRAKKYQDSWKERDILIIKLFWNTAMRCAALYKLDVSSIDFENHTLITTEKGSKVRTYVLEEELFNDLLLWLKKRSEILGERKEEALFISNQKTRLDTSAIYRITQKYSKKIPEKNIGPHKIRASVGTYLLEKTNDIYFVQHFLGHEDPRTTELYARGEKTPIAQKAASLLNMVSN